MRAQEYEKKLRQYREQKYKMLLNKQELATSRLPAYEREALAKSIDDAIELIDHASNATERLINIYQDAEKEHQWLQIIDNKLGDVIMDSDMAKASTTHVNRRLFELGEQMQDLNDLVLMREAIKRTR